MKCLIFADKKNTEFFYMENRQWQKKNFQAFIDNLRFIEKKKNFFFVFIDF